MKQFTRPILAFFIAGLFLSSCSPRLFYQPAETQPDASEVIYTHGVPGLRSSVQGCEVVTELTSRGEKDMNLNVYIRNNSDSAFTFYPDKVEVRGYNGAGGWAPYRVFEADEYIRWKNTRDALIAAGVIVATVATILIIDELTDDNSSGSSRSNNDYQYVSDGAGFVYDLTWWMAWTIPAVADEPPPPPAYSSDFLLREHTLFPGEAVQGIVKVRAKPEYKQKILVEVPVNGVYAQFVFDQSKRRR